VRSLSHLPLKLEKLLTRRFNVVVPHPVAALRERIHLEPIEETLELGCLAMAGGCVTQVSHQALLGRYTSVTRALVHRGVGALLQDGPHCSTGTLHKCHTKRCWGVTQVSHVHRGVGALLQDEPPCKMLLRRSHMRHWRGYKLPVSVAQVSHQALLAAGECYTSVTQGVTPRALGVHVMAEGKCCVGR
jgi:hypothetical protein